MANKIILDVITGKFIDTGESSDIATRHLSVEHRARISAAGKGKRHSNETKTKISHSLKGRPSGMLGKHHSLETRGKMSAKMMGNQNPLGCHRSKETVAKIIAGQKGKKVSEETRAKLSASLSGRPLPDEVKVKLRDAMLKKCQDPDFIAARMLAQGIKPNRAELYLQSILDKHFPGEWGYTGDGQFIIGGKCPDFANVNGRKEVIELFGNYWHNTNKFPNRLDQKQMIKHYKRYGFLCIVIWEEELDNEEALVEHIRTGTLYIPQRMVARARYQRKFQPKKQQHIILDPMTKEFRLV